jgi:hypothetical protein
VSAEPVVVKEKKMVMNSEIDKNMGMMGMENMDIKKKGTNIETDDGQY